MNEPSRFDWSQLQAALAIARAGSFSAAARESGVSQPTLTRRVAALEARLGVRLFDRGRHGARLTEAGADILEHAEAMADAAGRAALAAAGREEAVAGTVRVTASRIVATHHLPEILADLLAAEPGLRIELVASDETSNLLRREADIAVRMFRPAQADLIARHVGDFELGLYAARAYLARRGAPRDFDDLMDHAFVGYDRSDLIIRGFREGGIEVTRDFFVLRTDDQVAYWQAVLAGAGIGFGQRVIGDAEPRVARVLPDAPLPALPVWLTAHAELRRSRRIRVVFDTLAAGLAARARAAAPRD